MPEPQKVSEYGNFADFGPIWGAVNCLTIKKYTFLKPVFKDLSFDTGFVALGPFLNLDPHNFGSNWIRDLIRPAI